MLQNSESQGAFHDNTAKHQAVQEYAQSGVAVWYGVCYKQNILVKGLSAGEEIHHSRLQCSLGLEAMAFSL